MAYRHNGPTTDELREMLRVALLEESEKEQEKSTNVSLFFHI